MYKPFSVYKDVTTVPYAQVLLKHGYAQNEAKTPNLGSCSHDRTMA